MVSALPPLRLTGAEVWRRGRRLLGPVDFAVEGTGLTIVIGPNGAGKTTFLKALHGLVRLTRGRLEGSDPEARLRQAYVFQTPTLLRRNVVQNLAYPLRIHGTPRKEAHAIAAKWATRIGLGGALDTPGPRLSGGEKQKLALARALIREPAVLFLDEPCANLDGRATREIETLLQEVRAAGTRIVMSTHDMGQARRLADDVVFLLHGRLHETGPAATFFDAPQTAEARAFLNGDIIE